MPLFLCVEAESAEHHRRAHSTCSPKFEFSFLNGNLMVRAGILLNFK
jgi:hypothetical protein